MKLAGVLGLCIGLNQRLDALLIHMKLGLATRRDTSKQAARDADWRSAGIGGPGLVETFA